jgi:ATP-binding cassette, subfamily A (ABC1), member 3
MIGYITREKELRQKELMKMMSVTESDIGWAWFISFFLFNIVTASLTSVMSSRLYENSDGFLLWIFWMFTFIAVIVFCMLISSFTSKAIRGILIGLLFFFGGVFLTLAIDYTTSGLVGIISLHPVAAFSFGIQEIGRLEDLSIGVTGDSMDFSDNPSGYNFRSTLNSLIADSIIWGIATWYFNRVIQPDYGQAFPFYFPFTLSFWCPGRASVPAGENDEQSLELSTSFPLEPVSETLKRQAQNGESIEIRGLCKTFGDKVAVDGLNLSMYKGQVTALLGHNGK